MVEHSFEHVNLGFRRYEAGSGPAHPTDIRTFPRGRPAAGVGGYVFGE